MDVGFVCEVPTGRSRRVEGVRRLLLSSLVVGVFGMFVLHGIVAVLDASAAAFTGRSDPVSIVSRPSAPMFRLRDLGPKDRATGFSEITYEGSVAGEVRLFADVADGGLAPLLIVTVTRGTGRGASFVADADGIAFSGRLSRFPAEWRGGIDDDRVWQAGESRTYRFDVRLIDGAGAGATADASFAWEARPV